MECTHHGFHENTTQYDRRRRVLSYVWTCEGCGADLDELYRCDYAPRFDRYVDQPQGSPEAA